MERERLRRVFTQGLDRVVGYALPLTRDRGAGWRTGPWFFRGERMYLTPGDSPMGFRLPLDSLPWVRAVDYPYAPEQDLIAPRSTRGTTGHGMARPTSRVRPIASSQRAGSSARASAWSRVAVSSTSSCRR
jgi:uncharacterized protein (DUF2126 family)